MTRRRAKKQGTTRSARWSRGLPWGWLAIVLIFIVGCCSFAGRSRSPGLPTSKDGAFSQAAAPSDPLAVAPKRAEKPTGAEAESPQGSLPTTRPAKTSRYCLRSCPTDRRGCANTVLEREGYLLSNNPRTKLADWAAYRVSAGTIGRSKKRKWAPDPDLPSAETLEPEDYRGAHAMLGTDRGHLVPLASFSGTSTPKALNYLSNVTPQRSDLNQRLWNFLEQEERKLVLTGGVEALYVVTGPLYESTMTALPEADEPHQVPSGYFKVLAIENADQLSVGSIIVSQDTPGTDSYCDHRVTIDEVERRTGLDLFSELPDAEEAALEVARGTLFTRLGCK